MTYRLLSVAGSDSGGGAGIQADIKTACALGVFAATAVTAVTVQNTQRVSAVHLMPPEIVASQISAVLGDIGADAIKVGMLGNASICSAVAKVLSTTAVPIILDPVMVSTSGNALLQEDAIDALIHQLLPLATLVTPNIPEADILLGLENPAPDIRLSAARDFVIKTSVPVLLKGGHGVGDTLVNTLITPRDVVHFETSRLDSANTHGTGCTLSSAIACFLAKGETLETAVEQAGRFVHTAIKQAPKLGKGHGPLGFF